MMILRGSTYDTVQHIYYIGYLYQFGRSLISGINTKYFNYTTYSRLPYVINNLMINANGTILFANVYNDDGNHLISIDLHQNKTRRLITYRNTSWMFRASTLGKNNKVFTIMRTIYEEFFFITTDLTTNTYKSIQLDEKSNSIPYSMWEI
jgi:hypothetical protein